MMPQRPRGDHGRRSPNWPRVRGPPSRRASGSIVAPGSASTQDREEHDVELDAARDPAVTGRWRGTPAALPAAGQPITIRSRAVQGLERGERRRRGRATGEDEREQRPLERDRPSCAGNTSSPSARNSAMSATDARPSWNARISAARAPPLATRARPGRPRGSPNCAEWRRAEAECATMAIDPTRCSESGIPASAGAPAGRASRPRSRPPRRSTARARTARRSRRRRTRACRSARCRRRRDRDGVDHARLALEHRGHRGRSSDRAQQREHGRPVRRSEDRADQQALQQCEVEQPHRRHAGYKS